MKTTIKKLMNNYANYMTWKQHRAKPPRLHNNKNPDQHPFKPFPLTYLDELDSQQQDLQNYIADALNKKLDYSVKDDRLIEVPATLLVGLVDRLQAVTHLNRDLLTEIRGLRPYNVELLKIAKSTGDAKDPFAAWETVSLWESAYDKQVKQEKAAAVKSAEEKPADDEPYQKALRYFLFADLMNTVPEGGMYNPFKRTIAALAVAYCGSSLDGYGKLESVSSGNHLSVWYRIKDKPVDNFVALHKLDVYLQRYVMEINWEARQTILSSMNKYAPLEVDEIKKFAYDPLPHGKTTTINHLVGHTRVFFKDCMVKLAVEIINTNPEIVPRLITFIDRHVPSEMMTDAALRQYTQTKVETGRSYDD